MFHILLELPGPPHSNGYPLTLEETLAEGWWVVKDRFGLQLGDAFEVRLSANRLPNTGTPTPITRVRPIPDDLD